jgi:hypothetical protein
LARSPVGWDKEKIRRLVRGDIPFYDGLAEVVARNVGKAVSRSPMTWPSAVARTPVVHRRGHADWD